MATPTTVYIGSGKVYTIRRIDAGPTITSTIADSEGTTDWIEARFERIRSTELYMPDLEPIPLYWEHMNRLAELNRDMWFRELYGTLLPLFDNPVTPKLNRKLMDHRVLGKKHRRS